ncbi:methyltransferase [Nitrospira sp.]|nr:methyltransferase [Nitrospira sp.]
MSAQTEQHVIDSQRRDWNRVAGGWEKWDPFFERQMPFLNHRLVGDARVCPGQRVLDLGSGTGYPALLAAQIVGVDGQVTGMDLAEEMLAVAEKKALHLGLSNVRFRTGDVSALPFGDRSFDAVISRFCLMFLPDVPRAATEIARVLKPGGWLATAVWAAPEKNPSISGSMAAIKQVVDLPQPEPNAPGIFRLAKAGDLAGMLARAGFVDLTDEEFPAEWSYASPEEYYLSLMELAAPIQNLMATLSPAQVGEVKRRLLEAGATAMRDGRVVFPITIRIVAARKPG